jgi:site-specific DNA-methyltransferase (adenine-specific)
MENIRLHLGDCLEAMRAMPDNTYDLAIVDPPYGINISKAGGYYHKKGKGQANPHTKKDWDNCIPSSEYFEQLRRVSKHQILWGGNYFTEYLKPSRCWIFWDKMKFVDNYADGELAWVSMDRNTKQVRIQHHGFLTKDGRSIHPTQKPVMLYEWILDNFANEGDKILDTHLGSGSIALACHNRGFQLDGWEIDKEYYNNALKRFEQHKAQLTIF